MKTALLMVGLLVLTASPVAAAKKTDVNPDAAALQQASAQLGQLQAARDSLSRLRWSLRQAGLDARERAQAEQDRARDSLDKAASERSRLLEELRDARERAASAKPGPDALAQKREQIRQDMLDRAELLRDKVRFGLPWKTEERLAAVAQAARGIESYASPRDGLNTLIAAYEAEWRFAREIEREEDRFPRADGAASRGTRVRVGTLGAWYLTQDNVAGLLARSGSGDMPYAWHENLHPETQRALLTGIGSRELELPLDPLQTQASGPGYLIIDERGWLAKLTDLKDGPLARMPLMIARAILGLLILLGIAITWVYLRRRSLVTGEAADADKMRLKLFKALTHKHGVESVVEKADVHTVAGRMVRLGFDNIRLAPESLEQLMLAQESVEERRLTRGLTFMGIVASNAAFIGLLGTVLGILDAFGHLGDGGADAQLHVMAAIAEALVATAMGLAVAIPAVVFYNLLSHKVSEMMGEARELRHLILAAGLDAAARPADAARELGAAETGRRIAEMERDGHGR
ncbi:MAG: MotA/TolQ/ExbB proton channel family protein [Fibrobacteria bacterium]|nr:MotA/TolQ/ExbB proton channel family protein [Fibrobacteria bacterium]